MLSFRPGKLSTDSDEVQQESCSCAVWMEDRNGEDDRLGLLIHMLIVSQVFTVVAVAIVAACILFLSTNASSRSQKAKRSSLLEVLSSR